MNGCGNRAGNESLTDSSESLRHTFNSGQEPSRASLLMSPELRQAVLKDNCPQLRNPFVLVNTFALLPCAVDEHCSLNRQLIESAQRNVVWVGAVDLVQVEHEESALVVPDGHFQLVEVLEMAVLVEDAAHRDRIVRGEYKYLKAGKQSFICASTESSDDLLFLRGRHCSPEYLGKCKWKHRPERESPRESRYFSHPTRVCALLCLF